MSHELSHSSLEEIMNGGTCEGLMVQVLDISSYHDGGYKSYKLRVSDRQHTLTFPILTTPENKKFIEGLTTFSVVKINKFISIMKSTSEGEKFVQHILDMEMVKDGRFVGEKLDDPQNWMEKSVARSNEFSAPALSTSIIDQSAEQALPSDPDLQPAGFTPVPAFLPVAPVSAPFPVAPVSAPLPVAPVSALLPVDPVSEPLPVDPVSAPFPVAPVAAPLPVDPVSAPFPVAPVAAPLPVAPVSAPLPVDPVAAPLPVDPVSAPLPVDSVSAPLPVDPVSAPFPVAPVAAPLPVAPISQSVVLKSQPTTPVKTVSASHIQQSPSKKRLLWPIANLKSIKPWDNNWTIKARVSHKSDIMLYNNNTKERFQMSLRDDSGEIRAVAFHDACGKFYDTIKVDHYYYISKGRIQPVKPQFIQSHDYEIILNERTIIEEYMEEDIKKWSFVSISDIAAQALESSIDVIGVCESVGDLLPVRNNTGKMRKVHLVDNLGGSVALCLWDDAAERFQVTGIPVIAVKDAVVVEYAGDKELKYLTGRTTIHTEPSCAEAITLKQWYNRVYIEQDRWISFSEAATLQPNNVFSLLGVLECVSNDNNIYKSCIQCPNKKLEDLENGSYKCTKCNKIYSEYTYSLRFTANVSDPTGNQSITAFNDQSEMILGKPAKEMGHLYEVDKEGYTDVFEEVKFKMFVFQIIIKKQIFNNEYQLKYIVKDAKAIDYKVANKMLIASIKSITGMEI